MECWRWACWLWWCADVLARCVGATMVVRRLVVPWSGWLGRRVLCWGRYAATAARDLGCRRSGRRRPCPGEQPDDGTRTGPTCRCCGGVDFEGMASRWAVVTGCTDGIGKEFALQLAERGINLALVSRNVDKLQAVAREIDERNAGRGVKTRIVVADFTSSGGTVPLTDAYDAVRRGLDDLDVALLFNNAGIGYPTPERLLDLPPCCSSTADRPPGVNDVCRDVVECNVLAAVAMCRIVMPLMARDDGGGHDRVRCTVHDHGCDGDSLLLSSTPPSPPPPTTNRGGVVVNVSSLSAQLPCPLLTVYGATKAFLEKFSVELAAEYGHYGGGQAHKNHKSPRIAVRCLTPGFIATKMSRLRAASKSDTGWSSVPCPSAYVRHSLRSLSCHCGCRQVRRRWRDNVNGGEGNGSSVDRDGGPTGWLMGLVSAVTDSPSSPLSQGRSGVVTTGYLIHTVMAMGVNGVQWVMGDGFVSNTVDWLMAKGRERLLRADAKKANKASHSVRRQDVYADKRR